MVEEKDELDSEESLDFTSDKLRFDTGALLP